MPGSTYCSVTCLPVMEVELTRTEPRATALQNSAGSPRAQIRSPSLKRLTKAHRRMSWRSEGDREENQRPLLMAARSSMVRMGSSMVCLVSDWRCPIVAPGTGADAQGCHLSVPGALFVAGRLLGQEGLDADAAVGVVQVAHEVIALVGQLLRERRHRCVVQQFLDAGQGIRRALVEPGRQG